MHAQHRSALFKLLDLSCTNTCTFPRTFSGSTTLSHSVGPCTRAVRDRGITVDRCDNQGNYDIRRCFERQDNSRTRYSCVCVHPDTGTVMNRTRKDVENERDFDRADCFRLGKS